MSERSVTIWNLLVGITIVSLIATSFKLFPMNKKYNRLKERSNNLQFGTDKELEDIIAYLENRLADRSDFRFSLNNTPMMLTNVLTMADGTGRRSRRNRNAVRVALVYQRNNHFQAQIDYRGKAYTVSVGDNIENIGKVELIDATQVLIRTSAGLKAYPAPGNLNTSFNQKSKVNPMTNQNLVWVHGTDYSYLKKNNKKN
ncbi:MAG: hypothetical protein CMG57_03365 [Candidatus Marinimicrobia bacterium]|nr:hypothetical protein [Candidatus Neomarinimicrobiota bacterium]